MKYYIFIAFIVFLVLCRLCINFIESTKDTNVAIKVNSLALSKACFSGAIDQIKLLLDQGANINAVDEDGYTVLMEACGMGHVEITKLLLEKGADVNATDEDGCTALMFVCFRGDNSFEIAKLLLEHDANVNVTDKYGYTPLMNACWNGAVEVVKLLVRQGTNINTTNKENGQTALHRACIRYIDNIDFRENFHNLAYVPYGEIIKLLLEHGADTIITYHEDNTPLTILHVKDIAEIVKLLSEKGIV